MKLDTIASKIEQACGGKADRVFQELIAAESYTARFADAKMEVKAYRFSDDSCLFVNTHTNKVYEVD